MATTVVKLSREGKEVPVVLEDRDLMFLTMLEKILNELRRMN